VPETASAGRLTGTIMLLSVAVMTVAAGVSGALLVGDSPVP
jgi:hypothetical protein